MKFSKCIFKAYIHFINMSKGFHIVALIINPNKEKKRRRLATIICLESGRKKEPINQQDYL